MKRRHTIFWFMSIIIILLGATSINKVVQAKKFNREVAVSGNNYFDDYKKGNIIVREAKDYAEKLSPRYKNLELSETLYKDLNSQYPNKGVKVYLLTGGRYKKDNFTKQQFIVVDIGNELNEYFSNNKNELIKLNQYISDKSQMLDQKYDNYYLNDQIIVGSNFTQNPLLGKTSPSFQLEYSHNTNIQKVLNGTVYE